MIDKPSVEKGAADIVAKVRAARAINKSENVDPSEKMPAEVEPVPIEHALENSPTASPVLSEADRLREIAQKEQRIQDLEEMIKAVKGAASGAQKPRYIAGDETDFSTKNAPKEPRKSIKENIAYIQGQMEKMGGQIKNLKEKNMSPAEKETGKIKSSSEAAKTTEKPEYKPFSDVNVINEGGYSWDKLLDRARPVEVVPVASKAEVTSAGGEKTIEDFKADFDAKADAYATVRGNARGSRGYLSKLLGLSISRKGIGFSENVEEMEEVKAARLEYLGAKKAHSKAAVEMAFKEYQDKLQSETASPEELEALRIKWENIGNYHNRLSDIELQGKFVDKTIEYYKTKGGVMGKAFGKYLDLYQNVYLKKVPPKVRAAISIAMLGGTVAGLAGAIGVAGGFAAGAALVSRPVRFALAPLMPAMTYAGTGKVMEKGLQLLNARKGKKRSADFAAVMEKMKSGEASPEEVKENLMALLGEQSKDYGNDLVKRGFTEDRCESVRNVLTGFVGARSVWVFMSGTEAISSLFEGKSNLAGAVQEVPKSPLYTEGADGKIRITPKGMEAISDTPAKSVNLPPEDLEKIQKLSDASAAAKSEAMAKETANKLFTGADVPDSTRGNYDQFQKPSVVPEQGVKMSEMRASDTDPQIARPSGKLLGYQEVQRGGGIEKSAQEIIKANPKGFGLNPDDPRFNSKVGAKAHELAEGMRNKFGLSHKDFDRIASHKIQTGDQIRVYQDPISKKMNLTYNGKAFDNILSSHNASGAEIAAPKVSQIAPAEEIASVKPKLAVEDVTKPKVSAVEHQPKKPDWMKPYDENMARAKQNFDYANVESNRAHSALRASQEMSLKDSAKLNRVMDLIHNRSSFARVFGVEHMDWDKAAEDFISGHKGVVSQLPETQTWEDLQKIKFRDAMAKELEKRLGPAKGVKLQKWLARISNEQFRLIEKDVRARINYR